MKSLITSLAFLLAPYSFAAQTDGNPPPAENTTEAKPVSVFDGFDERPTLKWEIRNADEEHYGYDKKPGTLTITTQKGGLHRTANNCKNVFLLPNPTQGLKDFEVTTCLVDFKPTAAWHQAGLVCFDDEDNYVKFVCEYDGGAPKRKLTLMRETRGAVAPHTYFRPVPPVERIWLRLTKRGNRYAYSMSVDGKSFRAHGELPWGNGAPKWVGLIAKNSNNNEVTKVDASFDSFELRERLSSERPVYLYAIPSDGVNDLLDFIVDLREFRPKTSEEAALHNRRAPILLRTAAQRIFQQEKDKKSKAYQMALLVLLEDRARMLPTATPAEQQQTVDLVKIYLTAKREEVGEALEAQDVALALSTGNALETAGRFELATRAYREFAELVARGKEEEHGESLALLKGAGRRLTLVGRQFESEVVEAGGAKFDWTAYRDKAVLILFISGQSDSCLPELRHVRMLHEMYRDRGFDVLCICIDCDWQPTKRLLEEERFPWSTLFAENPDMRHPLVTHFGVTTAPTMLVVDKQGKVASPRMHSDDLDTWLVESLGPPYIPKGKLTFVALSSKANLTLTQRLGNIQNNDLSELPQGDQTFAGVKFQVADALIQLAGQNLRARPEKVEGIPVEEVFNRLYFLHATAWNCEDGTVIGQYRVNYQGGAAVEIPVVYGQDVRDWNRRADAKPATRGTIAWIGRNPYTRRVGAKIRLYLTAWENPHPDKRVLSIDYVSLNTTAAPFCVAITMEHQDKASPGNRD